MFFDRRRSTNEKHFGRPYRTFLTVFRKITNSIAIRILPLDRLSANSSYNRELYRIRTLTEHLTLKTFFDGVEYKISDEKASKIQLYFST
jgi:hypothetical protein